MKKLTNKSYRIATAEEVDAFVKDAEEMVEKYGWKDRTVTPFGYGMKVPGVVEYVKDYARCTRESKRYLLDLANGLVEILNEWERQELQPKVTVRIIRNGKVKSICEEFARSLIEDGVAEAV